MRNLFFEEFIKIMREDESLFFLTGDTGFNLVEPIFVDNPDRSVNVGVAEQNMIGIASGLANVGYVPVCYAITNFLSERCFEQIRNDICLHEYKAILVGTSTGYDNGALGATHHSLDDIAVIKSLPNIRIYSPSGNKSIMCILSEVMESKEASYIRITKGGIDEPSDVENPNHFIHEGGSDVLVISHGKMVGKAMAAHEIDSSFSVFAMDRIKPLDNSLLHDLFSRFGSVVVIEDNFRSGLYNSICQWSIEDRSCHNNILSISPEESYSSVVGDPEYLEEINGLSISSILESIASFRAVPSTIEHRQKF